jgi:phosphate transport system protein
MKRKSPVKKNLLKGMIKMPEKKVEDKDQSGIQSYLYASDKERLRDLVSSMTQEAAASIRKAVIALKASDIEMARKVIDEDDLIDEKEEQIDQECLYSIAMRQPVREDLRFVYAVMKIVVDLERIGDQSVNIAMNVLDLKGNMRFPEEVIPFVENMAEENIKMLEEVMAAFTKEDAEVICSARERRKVIKETKRNAIVKINELFISEKSNLSEGDRLQLFYSILLTLRNLSRISDHTLNLAERVSFIATGISPLTSKRNVRKKADTASA